MIPLGVPKSIQVSSLELGYWIVSCGYQNDSVLFSVRRSESLKRRRSKKREEEEEEHFRFAPKSEKSNNSSVVFGKSESKFKSSDPLQLKIFRNLGLEKKSE
ncbi:hypothetical protein Ahy_B08g089024 isoform F [Arachis hypogaea]|uniref:Uncharacterized protein n=1 Tax=Arachis hypogaea TaxID=3818 RepID=A0A444XXH3_ARAHY|nr:hypothetical protein Ahy_B08g089024 isoform F [Arachis hypogaea]